MAYDLEEQEQIDQLKAWWAKYGTFVLTVLVIVLGAVAAWRGLQWYQTHQATKARGYFEALEQATRQPGDDSVARVNAAMKTLRDEFSKTDYAARGALLAAAALMEKKDVAGAKSQLDWLAQSSHPALVPVARLRIAGLLLDQKDYNGALEQLKDPPPSFEGMFADRRGDILLAQGNIPGAKESWKKAMDLLGSASPLVSIVKLKLESTGG